MRIYGNEGNSFQFDLIKANSLVVVLYNHSLYNHSCIEIMKMDIHCIPYLRYAKSAANMEQIECLPVMFFCPACCYSLDRVHESKDLSTVTQEKKSPIFCKFTFLMAV